MTLLVTELTGSVDQPGWRTAYRRACLQVEEELGVRIVDIAELALQQAPGAAPHGGVALLIHAVGSGEVADGSARSTLAASVGRQLLDPHIALGVPAHGESAASAVAQIARWFPDVPDGARRWTLAVSTAEALHVRVLVWLHIIADSRASKLGRLDMTGGDELLRRELPSAPAAADPARRRIFRGTPG